MGPAQMTRGSFGAMRLAATRPIPSIRGNEVSMVQPNAPLLDISPLIFTASLPPLPPSSPASLPPCLPRLLLCAQGSQHTVLTRLR